MKKVNYFLLSFLVGIIITGGILVYAANCAVCEEYGNYTELYSMGTHLWDSVSQHTVRYSENGIIKQMTCTITISEDRISWICPSGHGEVTSRTRHTEIHSSGRCIDLDYFLD